MSETLAQEAPIDLTGSILAVTSQLVHAIRRETAALREMRIGELEPLQNEKARLIELYRASLERLRTGAARITQEEESRGELRAVTAELADAAAENERLLRASRTATERVVRVVVDAVRKHRNASGGYTAEARTRRGPGCAINGVTIDHKM